MKSDLDLRKLILQQPEYWMEKINGELHDLLINYKEQNNLKKKDLAKLLGVSAGRLSQILSDEDFNYSLKTYLNIIIKLGRFPKIEFQDQEIYLTEEENEHQKIHNQYEFSLKEINSFNPVFEKEKNKVIQMKPNQINNYSTELSNASSF